MAKKKSRSKKRSSKRKGSKRRTSKKAKSKHIPLNVLEKRARRLNSIVKSRGGSV